MSLNIAFIKSFEWKSLSLFFYGKILYTSLEEICKIPLCQFLVYYKITNELKFLFSHVLFPLLTCLLEKCELATCSPKDHSDSGPGVCSAASFKGDLEEFIRIQGENAYYQPNKELDEVMLLAIRVLRIHLLELEKVHELCDNFCERYVGTLKASMPKVVGGMDERAMSTRPTSSLSSPSHTVGSISSPTANTPMNSSMPVYPSSYDNHVAASADSNISSHNVSFNSM